MLEGGGGGGKRSRCEVEYCHVAWNIEHFSIMKGSENGKVLEITLENVLMKMRF